LKTNEKVQRLVKPDSIPQLGGVNETVAQQMARDWFKAWNRHDLHAILAHYAEDVELTSPFIKTVLGEPTGIVRGKPAVREYFAKVLATFPELTFSDLHVLVGVNTLSLHYQSVNELMAAEVVALDPQSQIASVHAHYSATSATSRPARKQPAREWRRGDYLLTDDRDKLDLDVVCALLHSTYWANDRPREVIAKCLRHSTCLNLFHGKQQVGLIRGVTDHATFTWVCDVVIQHDHRGKGLGKWIVKCFLEHPDLQTISHHLCTKDAHALYEGFGFQRIEALRRSDRPMPFRLV
jgi:ketosteroid isomerase-like protein/GNAT superfamily N-acetyltransferase